MTKQSADDFFKSMRGSSSTSTLESADDFFEKMRTGQKTESQKQTSTVLEDTLSAVGKSKPKPTSMNTTPAKQETNTIDFKAEQKKQEEKKEAIPSFRLTPAPETPTIESKLLGVKEKDTVSPEFQDKIPAAQFLQPSSGPDNASQIPGISQYEINKKEIESAPPVIKQYAQAMNYLTEGNPIGVAIGNAFSGNSGATRKDSSGNKLVDKAADVVNNLVTPFITPTGASMGQGIIGSTYDATGRALSGKAGQAILRGAEKVIPGSQNVVKVAATEGIAGGLQGVGFGLQQGQDSGREIGRNAALGVSAGGVLGGLGAAAGEVLGKVFSKVPKSTETAVLSSAYDGLTREQQIYRQYLDDVPLSDDDFNFMTGPDWNEDNLIVKPKAAEVAPEAQPLTREQEIYNKAVNKEDLTPEEMDYVISKDFNNDKLIPEKAPVTEPVNTEVAATAEKQVITEVKKPSKNSTNAESKTEGIRANYKTMTDSKAISSTLKGKIDELDQTYQVSKNADVVANSNAALKDLAKVESDFLASGSTGAQHISNGYRAMQELDKAGEHARALAIADKLAKDLTEAGQTVQAASLISRLSPEGQLLNLIRTAEKNGKVVDVADSVKFKKLADTIQNTAGAGKTENAITDILNRLENGTADADDIKALGEYLKTAESKIQPKVVKDRLPKELKDTRKRDKVVSFLEAQEAAAKARIDKRRGRLNSMPVDEWIDYSILIAAKVGKGIIKAETHIEEIVKLFGEDIRPLATQVFEKAQELVGSVTKSTLKGDFIKADNAFKRITGKATMNHNERIVEKYISANPEVTPKDIEALRKLSKSLTDLQGLERTQADMAMQKILNSYEKSSIMDKVNAIRYIAMLFNSSTQAINALSGPAMATTARVADMFGVMIDSSLSTIMKTPRTTTLYGANPVKFAAEYFKALKTGAKAGWEGVNPAGIHGANEIRGLTFKGKYNPLSYLERSLGAVSKGADYATYSAIYKGEMEKHGFLDALQNGIKRSDKEGIKRHIRKFINDPSEIAMEQADRIAKNSTFQRNDTLGGETANWLNSGTGKVQKVVSPVVRTVFPFVRTPINIASTAVTLTPGGIIKGLIQLSSKSNASQREAIRTLSLGLTGTGLSAVGYYLNQLGIITGSNDSGDKNVDNIREQVGKGKYRFNTSALQRYVAALLNGDGAAAAEKAAKYQQGDKQFDYNKLQPLAFPLAIGAEASTLKGKGAEQQITGTVSGAAGSLFGMSTLKGVQDVFQPSYGGTQGDKATGVVTRLGESFLKSFSPSMLAQEARRQDPIMRKTAYNDGIVNDVTDYYKSRTPGLSKSLPANKTTLGQNKLNAPGIMGQYLNPYKSEVARYTQAGQFIVDLMERTGDTSIAPTPPAKTVRGKNDNDESVTIAIPPKRYEKLQEDIGNEIINRVMEIESGTDEELVSQLEDIYSEVRKEYMDELKEELGLWTN